MIPSISVINENYRSQLRSVSFEIVKDYELAKDVMQESLVKIWRNKDKFDSNKGTLYTWMRNIVTRTSLDVIRTKHFKTSREMLPDNTSAFNINITQIDFDLMLKSIDTKFAFIIRKIYLEGFGEQQISTIHNIPLGTVKSRKRAGLRELRKIYKNEKYN